MTKYRTALGKTVDMSVLAAKNEKVRAVGNMKVNARGDTIDSYGKVVVPATKKVGESYSKMVGNKSAQPVTAKPAKPEIKEELTLNELELEDSFEDDLEVEQIKAKEKAKK